MQGTHVAFEPIFDEAELISDDELAALLDRSQNDSVFHVKEVQGVETLEVFQEALLRAVEAHERVAVRSCHDMGKTWTMSKLVLWFTSTHPECKVVTTAPTARQVKLLLWSEIRAGHAKSKYPLGGEMGVQEWKIAADWWAVGFTTQKEAAGGQGQKNSGFQGIHAPWVLVIFDEATGIPPDVWKQLEGLLTSANVRFVAIGNPTTKSCEFFNCFSDPSYKKLHFSCYDSPNLIANGITDRAALEDELQVLLELSEEKRLERLGSYKIVRPHLLTTRWVMSMAFKWGLNHPLFVSKAEGTFPDEDEACLMPLGIVEEAQRRRPAALKKLGNKARLSIGVDVARKGGDKSVITRLKGPVHMATRVLVKRLTTEVAGSVIAMVNDLPEKERLAGGRIVVDATGIGSGVLDILREYQRGNLEWRNIEIVEFHCGETWKEGRDGTKEACVERQKKYVNKKAEAFILLSEDVKTELALLEEDVYLEELPTIQYDFDSKGRWEIEDKKAYKKRTGRGSPDHADSLSLANYGRYHTGGFGTFTEQMGKAQGKTLAGRLRGDE
jgi:phage terminase large subunit